MYKTTRYMRLVIVLMTFYACSLGIVFAHHIINGDASYFLPLVLMLAVGAWGLNVIKRGSW
jgi:hypothetical protein